jgi:hypothetical protein
MMTRAKTNVQPAALSRSDFNAYVNQKQVRQDLVYVEQHSETAILMDAEEVVAAAVDASLSGDVSLWSVHCSAPQEVLPVVALTMPHFPVQVDADLLDPEDFTFSSDEMTFRDPRFPLAASSQPAGGSVASDVPQFAETKSADTEREVKALPASVLWALHRVDPQMERLERFVCAHRLVLDAPLHTMFRVIVLRNVIAAVASLHQKQFSRMSLNPGMIFVDKGSGATQLTCEGMRKGDPSALDCSYDLAGVLMFSLWLLDDRKYGYNSLRWLACLVAGADTGKVPFDVSMKLSILRSTLAEEKGDSLHPKFVQFVVELFEKLVDPGHCVTVPSLLESELFSTDVRVYYSSKTSVQPGGDAFPTAQQVFARIGAKSCRAGAAPQQQLNSIKGLAPGLQLAATGLPRPRKRTSDLFIDVISRSHDRAEFDECLELFFFHVAASECLRWLSLATGCSKLVENAAWTDKPAFHELRDGQVLARLTSSVADVSFEPEWRVAQFLDFCRESLGMSRGHLFTAAELLSGERDQFVLLVLCRVAVLMHRLGSRRNANGRLDVRCPEPSRAMCVIAGADGFMNTVNERITTIVPPRDDHSLSTITGKDWVGLLRESRQAYLLLPVDLLKNRSSRQVEVVAMLVDRNAGHIIYEWQLFAKDVMRNSFVPLWLLTRLGSILPVILKQQHADPNRSLSQGSASAPRVVPASPVTSGTHHLKAAELAASIRATEPTSPLPSSPLSGGSALTDSSGSLATGLPAAFAEEIPAEEESAEIVDCAEDLALFLLEGGFVDSRDPQLTERLEGAERTRRILPLLGTARLRDLMELNANDPDEAQAETISLLKTVMNDAVAYRKSMRAAGKLVSWVVFDIATYVVESRQTVEDMKYFASLNGFSRSQMFSTPKFAEVRYSRGLLLEWLERLSAVRGQGTASASRRQT